LGCPITIPWLKGCLISRRSNRSAVVACIHVVSFLVFCSVFFSICFFLLVRYAGVWCYVLPCLPLFSFSFFRRQSSCCLGSRRHRSGLGCIHRVDRLRRNKFLCWNASKPVATSDHHGRVKERLSPAAWYSVEGGRYRPILLANPVRWCCNVLMPAYGTVLERDPQSRRMGGSGWFQASNNTLKDAPRITSCARYTYRRSFL